MARRMTSASCRVLAACAIAAKLLVPAGYMPGALADGGPIMLCDSGLPEALAGRHEHGAPEHGHDADPAAQSGDEQPAADHSEWDRCSLGVLAGLAAVTTEWRFDLPAGGPSRAEPIDRFYLPLGEILAFRARGPPVALS